MKINKFIIHDTEADSKGLKEINISRLGSVIALVGRNGSGKTRVLDLLENQYYKELDCGSIFEDILSKLPTAFSNDFNSLFSTAVIRRYFELEYKLEGLNKHHPQGATDQKMKAEWEGYVREHNELAGGVQVSSGLFGYKAQANNISESLRKIFRKSVRRIKYSEVRELKDKIEEIDDPSSISFEKLIENVTQNYDHNELSSINKTALDYLAKLPHQLVIDKDEAYGNSEEYEKRTSFKRFAILKRLIKDFLNKDLEWEKQRTDYALTASGVTTQSSGVWKLNSRKFNYQELSDGEKTLFAYCLLFFLLEINSTTQIRECIVIIDEPELHLHPESELWLINGIRSVIQENGQLWIATHSLSILSSLNHDEIFMVKNGEIFPPDKSIPGRTLTELMGLNEHVERLESFISDISKWAYVNFMTQCFLEPEVVKAAQPNDPEIEVFFRSVAENKNGNVLLDFGAGQGRILGEVNSNEEMQLNYYALEPNKDHHERLKVLGTSGIYSDYSELPDSTFDFILICNVLHEIPVTEWEGILNKCKGSLTESGHLILIEDLKLPKGEKIEKNGFIILDQESFELVIAAKNKIGRIYPTNNKYKERILCLVAKKETFGLINKETIDSGLKALNESVLKSLKNLRSKNYEERELLAVGRTSAFLSQLYVNTAFARESLNDLHNG